MYQHVDGTVSDQWCENLWNADTCCEPFWVFSLDGDNITGNMGCEDDADEKALWAGPDGPAEVWTRHRIMDPTRRHQRPWQCDWSAWEQVSGDDF